VDLSLALWKLCDGLHDQVYMTFVVHTEPDKPFFCTAILVTIKRSIFINCVMQWFLTWGPGPLGVPNANLGGPKRKSGISTNFPQK